MPRVVPDTFPLRVNVNFALDDSVSQYVTELNRILVNEGIDEISFQTGSGHQPHITLLMGEVGSEQDLNVLTQILTTFCNLRAPVAYSVTAPYLRKPLLDYIFVDVVPAEPFRELRVELLEHLGGVLKCDDRGGRPHITIGCSKARSFDLATIAGRHRHLSGSGCIVRLSVAGERGTCGDAVGVYQLGGRS